MSPVYLVSHSIASPLGLGTQVHWEKMKQGLTGISLVSREDITMKNFYAASIPELLWEEWRSMLSPSTPFSRLETLMLATLMNAADGCPLPFSSPKTLFVFSTTKGNIDSIHSPSGMETLPALARKVTGVFQNPNSPIVISNACISGLSAILMAKSMLQSHSYEQVVVCGADILSEFTVSGFQCLHAISPFPCKPFDRDRMGLSPGEACGVVVLSNTPISSDSIQISGGATSNDANHISGPSRTGDGLALAITKAIKTARISPKDIDYVCTHGTATLYNDESESKALALANLNLVPANSLKGYFGHTFGAAGLIETILTAYSMKNSQVLASLGYSSLGVSTEMNIISAPTSFSIQHSLKTASGFGSCNAALVLSAA